MRGPAAVSRAACWDEGQPDIARTSHAAAQQRQKSLRRHAPSGCAQKLARSRRQAGDEPLEPGERRRISSQTGGREAHYRPASVLRTLSFSRARTLSARPGPLMRSFCASSFLTRQLGFAMMLDVPRAAKHTLRTSANQCGRAELRKGQQTRTQHARQEEGLVPCRTPATAPSRPFNMCCHHTTPERMPREHGAPAPRRRAEARAPAISPCNAIDDAATRGKEVGADAGSHRSRAAHHTRTARARRCKSRSKRLQEPTIRARARG